MRRRSIASFLVFIGVSLAIALSPVPQPKPTPPTTKHRPQPHSLSTSIEAVAATPTPAPTPEITWLDNPNGCNEQTQWIAAEPPFHCIDKQQSDPVPTSMSVPTAYSTSTPQTRPTGSKYDWLTAAGIPQDVWSCADELITRESGWRIDARNPSSGALGIPQALPGEKMASAGADYLTNPVTQLRWMHGYVNARYGGFCQALAHSHAVGWY